MKTTTFLATLGAALALAAPAAAGDSLKAVDNAEAVNGGFQALRDYNLIVLKDLKSSSSVDGRTLVGGDLTGGSSNYFVNPGALKGGDALVVGGDVSGSAKNINNGGSLKVGGNIESGANMNGGGSVYSGGDVRKVNANGAAIYADGDVSSSNAKEIYAGGSISASNGVRRTGDKSMRDLDATIDAAISAYAEDLFATSDYLAGLDANRTMTFSKDGQQAIFDAGAGSGVAVYAISDLSKALSGRSQLVFTSPRYYDMVVINVGGSKVSLPSGINFNNGAGLGQKVIWNFYEASSLDLGSKAWFGSILAPGADLKANGTLEGSIVAGSFMQGGAVKMGGFSAGLAVEQLSVAVPEPSTWALLIAGFGLMGAMLRRRRATA